MRHGQACNRGGNNATHECAQHGLTQTATNHRLEDRRRAQTVKLGAGATVGGPMPRSLRGGFPSFPFFPS
jgi:hypothetical protein